MGWGTLDIMLAFLFKSAVRMFYYFKSSSWERTTALVTGHIVLHPIWLGCSSVKLHYKFDSNGDSIKGWDSIPFLGVSQAKYYADSFSHNLPRTIRVNPENPQETHFFERDQ